ncbi:hypothetical protein FA13DRAFT_1732718 [Coprinellus micaceus]|uniref:Uncharacterized protein n=1 Tax=Coprinellus micaceus TaxID=71717 RepID=A0A4Y7TBG6_COPMI|nr:hypothetical protein FA13DRAFT_1732718 [Coprinellus micaceus]
MELQCSGGVAVHRIRLAYASMSGGHIKPVALTRPLLSPRPYVPQLSRVNRLPSLPAPRSEHHSPYL